MVFDVNFKKKNSFVCQSSNEPFFFSYCRFLRRHVYSNRFFASTKRIVCFIYNLSFSPLVSFLNHLNTSDPNERCHFWMSESTLTSSAELLDTPVAERMYIERDEVIRVRVETDEFYDDEPGPPKLTEGVQVKRESKRAPYTVCVSTITFVFCLIYYYWLFFFPSMKCSIAEQGLGPVVWWNGATLVEEEDEMDQSWAWLAKKCKMYFISTYTFLIYFLSSFELLFDPRLNGHRGLGRCGCRNSITGPSFISTLSVGRHLSFVIIEASG